MWRSSVLCHFSLCFVWSYLCLHVICVWMPVSLYSIAALSVHTRSGKSGTMACDSHCNPVQQFMHWWARTACVLGSIISPVYACSCSISNTSGFIVSMSSLYTSSYDAFWPDKCSHTGPWRWTGCKASQGKISATQGKDPRGLGTRHALGSQWPPPPS